MTNSHCFEFFFTFTNHSVVVVVVLVLGGGGSGVDGCWTFATSILALLLYDLLLTYVGINGSTFKNFLIIFLPNLECLEGLAGHWAKILDLLLSLLVNLGIAPFSSGAIHHIRAGPLNKFNLPF